MDVQDEEGIKWADGKNMTSEDVAWWYKNEGVQVKVYPSCRMNFRNKESSIVKLDTPEQV